MMSLETMSNGVNGVFEDNLHPLVRQLSSCMVIIGFSKSKSFNIWARTLSTGKGSSVFFWGILSQLNDPVYFLICTLFKVSQFLYKKSKNAANAFYGIFQYHSISDPTYDIQQLELCYYNGKPSSSLPMLFFNNLIE